MADLELKRDSRAIIFVDGLLLSITIALVCFSLLMLYSTTGLGLAGVHDSLYFVKRQLAAAAVGFVLLTCAALLPLELLKKAGPVLMLISIILLVLTLLPGVGHLAGGARRWIRFGSLGIQPAEFVKLFFVIFLAGYFERQELRLGQFVSGVVKPVMYLGIICALLLKQPDFGSSAILALVTFGMALAAGVRLRHVVLSLGGAALCVAALVVTSPYRLSRVLSFLDPAKDIAGKGYQLNQSLIAVGSGYWSGVGLGASQQKLSFLPAAHTDFIFSVISEELGFVGAVAVIGMFALFLWRGLRVASRFAENTFAFTLGVGLTLLVAIPAFLNIGVVTGCLPTKGLVLPLVGYGGSSLIVSLVTVGLLLGLGRSFYLDRLGLHGRRS